MGQFEVRTASGYAILPNIPASSAALYARNSQDSKQLARKRTNKLKRFNTATVRDTRTQLKRKVTRVERITMDLLKQFNTQSIVDNDSIGIEDLDKLHMRMNRRLE